MSVNCFITPTPIYTNQIVQDRCQIQKLLKYWLNYDVYRCPVRNVDIHDKYIITLNTTHRELQCLHRLLHAQCGFLGPRTRNLVVLTTGTKRNIIKSSEYNK